MRRVVLTGLGLGTREDFFVERSVRDEAKAQWKEDPSKKKLTLFVMFYLDSDTAQRSILFLLKPILRGLRRVVYLHESQISQISVGKVVRLAETEPVKIEVLIEDDSIMDR